MVKVLLYRTMENVDADYYISSGFESLECELQAVCVNRLRPSYILAKKIPMGRYYNSYQLRQEGKVLRSKIGKFDLLLVTDHIDQPFDMSDIATKTAYWAYGPMNSGRHYKRLGDRFEYVFVNSPSKVPAIRELFPSATVRVIYLGAPEHVYFTGPAPKPVAERPYTIGFMGLRKTGKRVKWLKALQDAGFQVKTRDNVLTTAEYGRMLMDCSISLNLSENNEINALPFESMAAGCISVTDSNPDMELLLKQSPGLFARTFDYAREDPGDCIRVLRELVGQLKSNPQELSHRAQLAREEIRKDHLFSNRAAQILKETKLA
jgi:hypothetical protein